MSTLKVKIELDNFCQFEAYIKGVDESVKDRLILKVVESLQEAMSTTGADV